MTADARFWTRIAPKYAERPIRDQDAYQYSLERTRSYLRPEHRVLELGCGTGTTAIALAPAVAHVTAADLSEGMLDVARQRASAAGAANIGFHCGPAEAAPEGPYDAVMAFNLLHLLQNLEEALDMIATRLRPGGLFISKTPCLGEARGTLKYRLFQVAIPLLRLVGQAPSYVDFLQIKDLENAVQRAGFRIVETGNYPADTPGRYLVARRV